MVKTSKKDIKESKEEIEEDVNEDTTINLNNNPIRHSCIRVYSKYFGKRLSKTQIEHIEIGIFNNTYKVCEEHNIPMNWECQHFIDTYTNISRTLCENMLYYSQDIVDKILNGEIECHLLASMSPQELNPSIWSSLVDKYNEKMKNAHEMKMVSMSDHIVCRKCKGREIMYNEYQSRKADEGSTTAYTCLKCNYKWKRS